MFHKAKRVVVQVKVHWVITGRLHSSAAVGRLHLEGDIRLINSVLHFFHAGFHLSLVAHVMLVQALGMLEALHNKLSLRFFVLPCNSLDLLSFA